VNLEVLVDVDDPAVAAKGEAWITNHCLGSKEITLRDSAMPGFRARLLDAVGLLVARFAQAVARFLAPRRISK